jgi:P27 family predicted phage terminase small subunit
MSAGAKVIWDELVDEMAGAAVLRRVDKRALKQLCEDEALLDEIQIGFRKMAAAVAKSAKKSGKPLPGGEVMALLHLEQGRSVMRALRDLSMRTMLERREFGLTPSSRSRIAIAGEAASADALEMKLCG